MPMTHEEIAKTLRTTPQRVALIERTAMRKLARDPIIRDLYRQCKDAPTKDRQAEYNCHCSA